MITSIIKFFNTLLSFTLAVFGKSLINSVNKMDTLTFCFSRIYTIRSYNAFINISLLIKTYTKMIISLSCLEIACSTHLCTKRTSLIYTLLIGTINVRFLANIYICLSGIISWRTWILARFTEIIIVLI